MNTFSKIEKLRNTFRSIAVALIDPDCKNDSILEKKINLINKSNFDIIFIGGSLISDDRYNNRIRYIKNNSDLPIIIFPGSSNQISKYADALLFLSLISGRNPQYLIGEHVKSAPVIKSIGLETISTGYILLEGGKRSSVEIISNTLPIPSDKYDIILAHALAGQYLGNKLMFLESGSGAENHAPIEIVKLLSSQLNIPIIIGGGIRSPETAKKLSSAGANLIVAGTLLESLPKIEDLIKFTDAIHGN